MREATLEIIKNIKKINTVEDLNAFKRSLSKKYGFSILLNSDILRDYFLFIKEKKVSTAWVKKNNEKNNYCEIHNVLMEKKSVRILYGLYKYIDMEYL